MDDEGQAIVAACRADITSLCHALAPTMSYCGPRNASCELPRASAYSLAHEFDTASPALRNAQRNENNSLRNRHSL
ncbi:hypothetical protein AURDEDRAFT_177259 [Auricularia subglabra TFB-10046 SS5]|uniref:Uncharacterized protein n=1 Tax=Auricularia subglabra (strain TFB-10046 / SS5) TaxID=717982 RepID=J0LB42_AURST|nr:hypothetical protein AURDEDRAFT_177259 [Auricularia subglabra TFB-10046 SS5]